MIMVFIKMIFHFSCSIHHNIIILYLKNSHTGRTATAIKKQEWKTTTTTTKQIVYLSTHMLIINFFIVTNELQVEKETKEEIHNSWVTTRCKAMSNDYIIQGACHIKIVIHIKTCLTVNTMHRACIGQSFTQSIELY